eukprot:358114-Chlamydomonas_euryale.AAC.3
MKHVGTGHSANRLLLWETCMRGCAFGMHARFMQPCCLRNAACGALRGACMHSHAAMLRVERCMLACMFGGGVHTLRKVAHPARQVGKEP